MSLSLTGTNLDIFRRQWESAFAEIPADQIRGIDQDRLYLASVPYAQQALESSTYRESGVLGLLQQVLTMAGTSLRTLETGTESFLLKSDDVLQGYLALKALIAVEQEALTRETAALDGPADDTVSDAGTQYRFNAAFGSGDRVEETLARLRESFLALRTIERDISTSDSYAARVHGKSPLAVKEYFFSLENIRSRLREGLQTAGLPEDLLTVTQSADGSVVIQSRSHKPGQPTWQSLPKALKFLKYTAHVTRVSRQVLMDGDEDQLDRIVAGWGAHLTDLAGLKITVKGLGNLDPSKTYLLAPTHMSLTEYSILFMVLHGMSIGFMAKEEFKTNPVTNQLFGQAMSVSPRFVFIQRADKNSAQAASNAAVGLLSNPENRFSLVVYPQGTRGRGRKDEEGNRMDADLFGKGPLKHGIGFMSIGTLQAGHPVEIVPITINGLGRVWPKTPVEVNSLQGNEEIEIVVGQPLHPADYLSNPGEATPEQVKQAAKAMVADVERHYRATYQAPLSNPRSSSPKLDNTVAATSTWQAMRDHRVGPWALRNVGGRLVDRFVKWNKAPVGQPPIEYHDGEAGGFTFAQLAQAHRQAHVADYARVDALVSSQLLIQSTQFADRWNRYLDDLVHVRRPFAEAMARYIDAYEAAEHPSYQPVSQATYRLHQAIAGSSLFSDLDPDLRIWAFYTMEARQKYLQLVDQRESNFEAFAEARGRYYRMLGRGIRYRILNRIDSLVGGEVLNRGFKDVLRALIYSPKIRKLRNLSERVELVAELLARGIDSFAHRLDQVERDIAALKVSPIKKLLPHQVTFSHTAFKLRQLNKERAQLIALIKQFGDCVTDDVLTQLAGDKFRILKPDDPMTIERLLSAPELGEVKKAWEGKRTAEEGWGDAYGADLRQWINQEMALYQQSFQVEADTHRLERDIQIDRYEDLMNEARRHQLLTERQEVPVREALVDYRTKFGRYLTAADSMVDPASKTKEYMRKQVETDLFFAWLKLHWAVADTYREIGHPNRRRLGLVSAMFPDQVEFLNRASSKQLEGLRPIIESITFEQLYNLYFEMLMAGNDPRKLDRIMARWGLQATRQGVNRVHVYGAGVLAGALGQASGSDLLASGASVLQKDQVAFGVVPQMMGFSANHQGFSDYTFLVAFMASLGLGRPWVIYEGKNFDPMFVLGDVLSNGDGISFERDRGGSSTLQNNIARRLGQGVSPAGFDHGTRRFVTTPNPLATDRLSSFVPREYVFGGSVGEIGEAAKRAGVPYVPVYQGLPFNHDPDIRLSGKLFEGNFKVPYSIHGGAPMGGEAILAFGDPVPGWVLPDSAGELEEMGISLIENGSNGNDSVRRTVRRVIAAHTEVGRYRASLKPLKGMIPSSGGRLSMGGDGVSSAEPVIEGQEQKLQAIPVHPDDRKTVIVPVVDEEPIPTLEADEETVDLEEVTGEITGETTDDITETVSHPVSGGRVRISLRTGRLSTTARLARTVGL